MIINLWSTPRTGSVWYSYYLAKLYSSNRIGEMFNPYYMNIYHKNIDGNILNFNEWDESSFYYDYCKDSNNLLYMKKTTGKRSRNNNMEENYRFDIIKSLSPENRLILHNHVSPINENIRDYLTKFSYKNIYIYRRDRRAQFASYAIAYSSKIFSSFKSPPKYEFIEFIDEKSLIDLAERIKKWDELEKNGDIIAYEDIQFGDYDNMPKKQVTDYTTILSKASLFKIDSIMKEFNL